MMQQPGSFGGPAAPAGPPRSGFDSEYASLMAELGEGGKSSGGGAPVGAIGWSGSSGDITGGGSNIPPWRRPEIWQSNGPQIGGGNGGGAGGAGGPQRNGPPQGYGGGYGGQQQGGYGGQQQWGGQGGYPQQGGYGQSQDYANYAQYYQGQYQQAA